MKRVSSFVISLHVILFIWLALWSPAKIVEKKPIQVRTVIATPPPPVKTVAVKKAAAPKKPVVKKTAPPPKKPVARKATQKPLVSPALAKQLENAIAKIDEKSHKESAAPSRTIAKLPPKLQIDSAEGSIYASDLVQCLQSALELPQHGVVKLELTLKMDGAFVKMRVLESANNANKKFLETHLRSVHFPPFSGPLKKEKEHTFVITFYNN